MKGFLFDVYAEETGVSVWVLDEMGAAHHLHDTLTPSFFVGADERVLGTVCRWIVGARLPVRLKRAERYDLMARQSRVVLEVQVRVPTLFAALVRRVSETFPQCEYYNADLTIPQFYFFERGLFPLAQVEVTATEASAILEITTEDSPWALDYATPPLRQMVLRLEGENVNPNHLGAMPGGGPPAPLELTYDDQTYVVASPDPRELLGRVREHLRRADPDLIVTDWGDSFILPQLLALSQQYGVPLPLNRDARRGTQARAARSYFSYGRIVYKTASQVLFGRWHIDRENAFLTDDYGLEGVFEIARLTGQPVQQAARTSTGSGISAMEVATAYKNGCLIPWRKREPEAFKSALDLLTADKGGLTYQPIVGLHENVAELDFASMYPAIMARFNVSPETIHCACCPDSHVPEIGYAICRKQRGLVPETLAPLIDKRLAYKRLKREAPTEAQREVYRRRASAHKWLLVTCFGYLGYKNARFGRIEAHEAVTAYGREALLRAKDVVEARGYRVLHALTDSLWIVSPQARDLEPAALDRLLAEVEAATHLPVALEGVYRWVAFLPSRVDARRAVPNRYFGVMRDGELKIRGIELRRHDTPEFIKKAQRALIEELGREDLTPCRATQKVTGHSEEALATTRNLVSKCSGIPRFARNDGHFAQFQTEGLSFLRLLRLVAEPVAELRGGRVPLRELALTYHLSRDPREYKGNTLNAIVAQELAGRGVTLEPGESVRYVITAYQAGAPENRARAWDFLDGMCAYDAERYVALWLRAASAVLEPFGLPERMLVEWIANKLPAEYLYARLEARGRGLPPYAGPLWEYARMRESLEPPKRQRIERTPTRR